eukprot:238997-Prymnesium_polylepis.1
MPPARAARLPWRRRAATCCPLRRRAAAAAVSRPAPRSLRSVAQSSSLSGLSSTVQMPHVAGQTRNMNALFSSHCFSLAHPLHDSSWSWHTVEQSCDGDTAGDTRGQTHAVSVQ